MFKAHIAIRIMLAVLFLVLSQHTIPVIMFAFVHRRALEW